MAYNERASPSPPPKHADEGEERREIVIGVNNYIVRTSSPITPIVPPPPVSVSQVTSSGVRNIHLRSVPAASNSRRINLSDNLPPFSPNDNITKNNTRFSSSNPPPPTAGAPSPLRPPPAPLPPASSLVAASNGSTSNGNSNRPSSASIAQRLNDPCGLSHHRNNNDNNGGMGTGNGHGMMQTGNGQGMMQNGSGNLANINGIHHGNNGPNNHRFPGIHTAFVPLSHERPIAPLQFNGLVKSILDHPSFPLVFCGAYESSTGSAPIISDIRAQNSLTQAAANCEQLETYAHKSGLSGACQASTSLDVFMCGMIAALNALKNPRPPSIPAPLHDTIRACGNQSHILSLTENQGGIFGDRHGRYGDRRHSMNMGREASLNGRFGSAGNGNMNNNNNNDGSMSTPTGASPSTSPTTPSVAVMTTTPSRPKLDDAAKRYLEKWFDEHFDNPYPTDAEKKQIAKECNLQLNQINNWFGNRRMRLKRKVLEQNRNATVSSHNYNGGNMGSINNDAPYEASVLAPRTKWRAIVSSKVSPAGSNINNGNGNRAHGSSTPGHDAIVNGLFGNSGGNSSNGNHRRQHDEDDDQPEKRRRLSTW